MMDLVAIAQLALLSITLSVITIVDIRTQTIPDIATAVLAVGGLMFQAVVSPEAFQWAMAGGLLYFLFFWAVRQGHWRVTGRLGMGFGDVKLAGAAGLWLAPGLLPAFIGIAAFSALLSVSAVAVYAGVGALSRRIPFGPFLALSLMVCWLLKVSNIGLEAFYAI